MNRVLERFEPAGSKIQDDPNPNREFRRPRWVPLMGFVGGLLFILFDFIVLAH